MNMLTSTLPSFHIILKTWNSEWSYRRARASTVVRICMAASLIVQFACFCSNHAHEMSRSSITRRWLWPLLKTYCNRTFSLKSWAISAAKSAKVRQRSDARTVAHAGAGLKMTLWSILDWMSREKFKSSSHSCIHYVSVQQVLRWIRLKFSAWKSWASRRSNPSFPASVYVWSVVIVALLETWNGTPSEAWPVN